MLKSVAFILISAISQQSFADEPVAVFGLPLGGKITPAPKACPLDPDVSKNICWINRASAARRGARGGDIHFPNPKNRPEWAAYSSFDISIGEDETLRKISIKTLGPRPMDEIERSISLRFGRPTTSHYFTPKVSSATWERKDIHIHLACSKYDFCLIDFSSQKEHIDEVARLAALAKSEAARPISP